MFQVLPIVLALILHRPFGQCWVIGEDYPRSLIGSGVGFGIMLAIYIASRGGTGSGNVKLGDISEFPRIIARLPIAFVRVE